MIGSELELEVNDINKYIFWEPERQEDIFIY
jgi:hypothetical protein